MKVENSIHTIVKDINTNDLNSFIKNNNYPFSLLFKSNIFTKELIKIFITILLSSFVLYEADLYNYTIVATTACTILSASSLYLIFFLDIWHSSLILVIRENKLYIKE
jgi:hypothetical protein